MDVEAWIKFNLMDGDWESAQWAVDEIAKRLRANPPGHDTAIAEEREACAAECERLMWAIDHGGKKYRRPADAGHCLIAIRERSNVKVTGSPNV